MVKITLFQMQNSCQVKKSPFLRKKLTFLLNQYLIYVIFFSKRENFFVLNNQHNIVLFFQKHLTFPEKSPFCSKTDTLFIISNKNPTQAANWHAFRYFLDIQQTSAQESTMQPYISNNKDIRDFVLNILKSKKWEIARHGKHVILRHIEEGANKIFSIPCTPSDSRAFSNFCRDYYRYVREFLIQSGKIQNSIA